MRNLIVVLVVLISSLSHAQLKRVAVQGKIIVEGNDLEGITIQNRTSGDYTVTNKKGLFELAMKINDIVQVRALQYQNFDVVINAEIIKSARLNIFLIQEVTQLDEVIVSNKNVTGNLNVDVNRVKTFTPKMDVVYFGVRQERKLNESQSDMLRNSDNINNLTSQNKRLINGLDLVNVVDQLLLPLFRSEVKNKVDVGVPEVEADKIKYYFGSEFLTENFDIPQHRVEEFIRYVEDSDFDFTLLNYGRELEFLELLNKKSKAFLSTGSKSKK